MAAFCGQSRSVSAQWFFNTIGSCLQFFTGSKCKNQS